MYFVIFLDVIAILRPKLSCAREERNVSNQSGPYRSATSKTIATGYTLLLRCGRCRYNGSGRVVGKMIQVVGHVLLSARYSTDDGLCFFARRVVAITQTLSHTCRV